MAITTMSINTVPGVGNNAWFQIIDDLNSNNKDSVEIVANKATMFKTTRFEPPKSDRVNDLSMEIIVEKHINELRKSGKFNETQLRNMHIKVSTWLTTECIDLILAIKRNNQAIAVFQMDKVGKSEWIMFNILHEYGVNVLVIDNGYNSFKDIISNKATFLNYGTNEGLKISNTSNLTTLSNAGLTDIGTKTVTKVDTVKLCDNPDDVIAGLCDTLQITPLLVDGYSTDIDTSILATKIYEQSKKNNVIEFFNNRIPKPTLEETSKIYRLNRDDADYIIHTLKGFIKHNDRNVETTLREQFSDEMKLLKVKGESASSIYNKAVTLICWLNKYMNSDKAFVYYGVPNNSEETFIKVVLNSMCKTMVVVSSEKLGFADKISNKCSVVRLPSSKKNVNLNEVSANTVTTMAYNASKRVDEVLYNDTLGMYKEGQITHCNTIHLACTFDEITMWWNKDMYLRPGFLKEGNSVVLPTQFGIVRGVYKSPSELRNLISKLACGKTLVYHERDFAPTNSSEGSNRDTNGPLIHNGVDINKTRFAEQKEIIVGGKVQPEVIKNSRNYKYSFLDIDKQNLIISKIQELLDDDKIVVPDRYKNVNSSAKNKYTQEYYDVLLNMVLNLDTELLRIIQWFNFTDYNPNIVVVSSTEQTLRFLDVLYLRFLNKLGFDILVFVPTQYNSVENFLKATEYESYAVGRPEYSLDLSNVKVNEDPNYVEKVRSREKRGLFSKLFN